MEECRTARFVITKKALFVNRYGARSTFGTFYGDCNWSELFDDPGHGFETAGDI